MRIEPDIKLDFEDVLMVPQRSSLSTRADVILEREYRFPHAKRTWNGIGIIAANMDVVGTFRMAQALGHHKMMTALHKHYAVTEIVDFFVTNPNLWDYVFYTVGSGIADLEKLRAVSLKIKALMPDAIFPQFICIDVANGYQESFVETVKQYRKEFSESVILAGNVVTANMTEELILAGADICKIGLGNGSVCLTRIKTGVGYPQLSAIDECVFAAHGNPHGHICSDGGCTNPGDICKAFAAGTDFVMLGGLLAATDASDGEIIEENGKKFVKFYGMSSSLAQSKHGEIKSYRASEGRIVKLPYKGSVSDVIGDILGGIRSACTYLGAARLKDLPKCAKFIKTNYQYNRIFEGKDLE